MKRGIHLSLVLITIALIPILIAPNTVLATAADRACENVAPGGACSFRTGTGNRARDREGACEPQIIGTGYTCRVGATPTSGGDGDPTGGGADGDPTGGGGSGDPTGGGASGEPQDASSPQQVSFQNPSRFTSIPELLAGIVNAALGLLGGLAVILIVFSGIKYMMSSNPGDVAKATEGIRNAIVGLMVVMGAYLIVQFVISALV